MSATSFVLICAHALFIQTISAACWGNAYNPAWSTGWAGEGLACATPALAIEAPLIEAAPCAASTPFLGAGWTSYGPDAIAASNGGGFMVSSASPIPPIGISITSENAIDGILAIGGELPFLGTVALEGALPTTGAGAVSYGCGNGGIGMMSEDIAPMAPGSPFAATGFGYGSPWNGGLGWAGRGLESLGCGCGTMY